MESNQEKPAEKRRSPETAAPQEKEHPFAPLQELTVAAVVQEVLARNPTLAQMAAIAEAAATRYPQVTSLDDPNFGFAMAPQSIGSNNVDFGYRVEVSQKYPFFGKRNLRGENALAEANAAAEDIVDVRLQLIETATSAFYDYYLVFRAFAVYEESLRLLQEARKSAATRYSTGKASQQEVLQMDVEIGRLRERGLTLERMKKVAVARINTLSHLPPDRPLPQAPRELSLPIALPPVEQFRAQAQAQRPDLKAVAARLAAERAQVALAEREFYPDVEPMLAYDTIMGNGPMRNVALQVGVKLNLPVRCSRRNAAVAEAQARALARQAELDRLTDQVNFQVQEAYEQVLESEKTVRLYQDTVLPAAQNNLKAARPAYTTGQIPLLSYLESERNLVTLRDRYYQAIADYYRRRATLERISACGLGQAAPEASPIEELPTPRSTRETDPKKKNEDNKAKEGDR